MKNAEWMLKNGMEFSGLNWGHVNGKNIVYYDPLKHSGWLTEPPASAKEIYSEKDTIVKNLITKWLDMEHKRPLLTDSEREYLKYVIKPFRNRVKYIMKVYGYSVGKETYCYLLFKCDDACDSFGLPTFNEFEMYKGMERSHDYTPEELGL